MSSHGCDLKCTYRHCRLTGFQYKFCAYCTKPVARNEFAKEHESGICQKITGGGDDALAFAAAADDANKSAAVNADPTSSGDVKKKIDKAKGRTSSRLQTSPPAEPPRTLASSKTSDYQTLPDDSREPIGWYELQRIKSKLPYKVEVDPKHHTSLKYLIWSPHQRQWTPVESLPGINAKELPHAHAVRESTQTYRPPVIDASHLSHEFVWPVNNNQSGNPDAVESNCTSSSFIPIQSQQADSESCAMKGMQNASSSLSAFDAKNEEVFPSGPTIRNGIPAPTPAHPPASQGHAFTNPVTQADHGSTSADTTAHNVPLKTKSSKAIDRLQTSSYKDGLASATEIGDTAGVHGQASDYATWHRCMDELLAQRPSPADREAFSQWLERLRSHEDARPHPGGHSKK